MVNNGCLVVWNMTGLWLSNLWEYNGIILTIVKPMNTIYRYIYHKPEWNLDLVGGLEHEFYSSIQLGI